MLRDKLMHHEPVDGFRWRSHEITRVEGFSDAVFGFAVTLLIVSLEVPRTSGELLETMRGFGAFVVTFIILAGMWHAQFTFFRRYGLEDRITVTLNLVLLFTVLFFVYPLKFLFSAIFTDMRLRQTVHTAHGIEMVVRPEHRPLIYAIFGAGFVAVFFVFLLLYRHAYKQREALGLNEFETYETQHTMRRLVTAMLVGLTYFGVAFVDTLPHKTASEKNMVRVALLVVSLALAYAMFRLVWLFRERKRVTKEFRERGYADRDASGER